MTTESNYVEILACICRIAKEAEDTTQLGGALLDQQEANIIFNDVGPIFNVHSEMLKKLREAEKNWKEDFCVGKVIVGFAPELLKAYPTFVNFVERTKQKIAECDRRNPRFHAFLKKCERRPECHRQPLKGEFWLFSKSWPNIYTLSERFTILELMLIFKILLANV